MGVISFHIYPESKLIVESFTGIISFEDYKKMKHSQYLHPDFSNEYNVLADFRNAVIDDKYDLKALTDYFKQNIERIGKRKSALLANSPLQSDSMALISQRLSEVAPVNSKLFFSIQEALEWLNVNETTLSPLLNGPMVKSHKNE